MPTKDRGFASMDQKKKEDITQKGGEARKKELGTEGYSEMGKKGGETRRQQMSPDDDQEIGNKGESRSTSGKSKNNGSDDSNDSYDGE